MGMMARMRGLASWFIIGVGGLFVLFMVISDSKVTDINRQPNFEIGSINGRVVTQQEFSKLVDTYKQNREAQTGQSIPESQMEEFRDQVWQAMVSQYLIEEKINEFGIEVSNDEISEAITGDNPPEFLKQGFIDSTGNFNRQAYLAAIYDENNREILIQVEDQIRQQKIQEKLQSYLGATVLVTDSELKRDFIDENVRMTAVYAAIDARAIPDSTIEVSESEIKNYYDENKDKYSIPEKRELKYVLFSDGPVEADTLNVKKQMLSIKQRIETDTNSFKTYAEIYSSVPYSKDTTDLTKLGPDIQQELSKAKKGDVLGPALTNAGWELYKYNGEFNTKDIIVRASHILISKSQNDAIDKAKADSVYQALINGSDFAKTAREISADPGSGARGGDLGWFGKGMMVKEFEEACFTGRVDQIQKPVKTQFGYHIIKVTGKSYSKYIIEKIVMNIAASGTTIEKASSDANDFAYLCDKDGFEQTAENYNYRILTTSTFGENSTMIPGIGRNKALFNFAFEGSVGDLSDVYKVTSGYIVAKISEIVPEGYTPIENLKQTIKDELTLEKKLDKGMDILKEVYPEVKESGQIDKARELNSKIRISSATNIAVRAATQGIGRDFAFNTYALNGPLNEISEPIRGQRACYLIKVTQRTPFDEATFEVQKADKKRQIAESKKRAILEKWLRNLTEKADIVDNRYKFYR